MKNEKLFTRSTGYSNEYSCSVVKIGELTPIEGSDFLSKAIVNGRSIVVRKDAVHEGDIMFYCELETQLNSDFLAINNLYSFNERERNLNYIKVQGLIDEGKMDDAKAMCGFFDKHGRVRIIKLRGCPSMGFLIEQKTMGNWCPAVNDIDLNEYIGEDFDTVDGKLFIQVYVPFVPVQSVKLTRDQHRQKRIAKFDRMIDGEFKFHYDTTPLQKNMYEVQPTDNVTISVKEHGTSSIFANVKVNAPKWGGLYTKVFAYLPKWLRFTKKVYDVIYSSRGVIKNKYINQKVTDGFYSSDVWGEYYELLKNYIPEGMRVYGEIVGYLTGSDKMIQKNFDYGCKMGTNSLMIYRINTLEADGSRKEWNVEDVRKWTIDLMEAHDELKDRMHPITILYTGTLMNLYPDVHIDGHWHEDVLEAMKNDVEHFGMEKREPMCTGHKVPREGIVLRINDDVIERAFKLKTVSFLNDEAARMDAGDVDLEMNNNVQYNGEIDL